MVIINITSRTFVNPNNLPQDILLNRLIKSDVNALCVVHKVAHYDDAGQFTHSTSYTEITSTLNDEEITAILAPAQTQAETDSIPELTQERTSFRDEYQSIIATLKSIEDNAAPTNAQIVNAIRYMAKQERRLFIIQSRNYKL